MLIVVLEATIITDFPVLVRCCRNNCIFLLKPSYVAYGTMQWKEMFYFSKELAVTVFFVDCQIC